MPAHAVSLTATYREDDPDNEAPEVNAGYDQMLDVPMNQVATLKGSATDDGIPGTILTYAWSKVSGPGTVTFSDDDALDTDATITVAGTYVLRLSVSDGDLTGIDDVTISVHDNGRLTYPIIYTDIPKPTADMSNYTDIYVIDLGAFGIYNDGTNAVATSAGINAALQYAKTLSANRIVFPAGTYLIKETNPIIFDHQDTIVDLNDATLQMNTNGMSENTMVVVERGTRNFRLTNGILKGDRYTHDYSSGGTHEHCRAIVFESGYNMEIDHLTVRDFTGFAVTSRTGINNTTTSGQYTYVNNTNLESGAFTTAGVKTADGTKIRTISPYDLAKYDENEFEFGQSYGYQGLFLITEREYQICLYEADMTFIEKKDCIQFKKITFPSSAKYVHLEFNQSNIPSGPYAGRFTDMEPPEHVHFHDNWMYRNRGLGQGFCGGQKWILENNLYEENGTTIDGNEGTLPAHGIDFEDGWDLMQDIVFRNNEFRNNKGDLVVCAGSEMIFEGNHIDNNMTFYERCENFAVRNNTVFDDENVATRGGVSYGTKTGHLSIHDNSYSNGHMYLTNAVTGKPLITLENDSLYNIRLISGSDFVNVNCTIEWTRWLIGSSTTYAEFDSCTFVGDDVGLHFYTDGPDVTVIETNCTGTLNKYGPNLDRLN